MKRERIDRDGRRGIPPRTTPRQGLKRVMKFEGEEYCDCDQGDLASINICAGIDGYRINSHNYLYCQVGLCMRLVPDHECHRHISMYKSTLASMAFQGDYLLLIIRLRGI